MPHCCHCNLPCAVGPGTQETPCRKPVHRRCLAAHISTCEECNFGFEIVDSTLKGPIANDFKGQLTELDFSPMLPPSRAEAISSLAVEKAVIPSKDPKGSKGPQWAPGLRGLIGRDKLSAECTGASSPSVASNSQLRDSHASSNLQSLVAESRQLSLRALPARECTQAISKPARVSSIVRNKI